MIRFLLLKVYLNCVVIPYFSSTRKLLQAKCDGKLGPHGSAAIDLTVHLPVPLSTMPGSMNVTKIKKIYGNSVVDNL